MSVGCFLLKRDVSILAPNTWSYLPLPQVQNEAKTPLKKFLLNLAIMSKFNEVKNGIIRRNSLWDKLVFSKIQVS